MQRMPFDGFLFASRVMVALEAHTSESVKQLIVDAQGVDDDKWCVPFCTSSLSVSRADGLWARTGSRHTTSLLEVS